MQVSTPEAPKIERKTASNPVKAEAGWPPAVIAGAYYTGVLLMRNLEQRGVRAYCFDTNPAQPGFKSVYGKTFLCPNPDEDAAGWLSFMVRLAKDIGEKPILIPAADQFVTAIAENVRELEKHFIFHSFAAAIQALLATKRRQYELAQAHGLTIPRSEMIHSREELKHFASQVQFPCVMKPLHCREWERLPQYHPLRDKKLAVAASAEDLLGRYESVAAFTGEVVAQEIIEGPDTAKVVYLSCYSRTGERLGSCMVREIRTGPINFGSASVVEPCADPETDELCDRFLKNIGYAGLCELELKRDSRDGKVKLIEVNPRYSGTSDAAPYAGVDIGWLHYLDLAGVEVAPVEQQQNDFRHICLQRDFSTLRSYRKAGLLSWRELLRSYRPPLHFYDFDARDWRISLATLVELFKIVFGPSIRRVFPKRRPAHS